MKLETTYGQRRIVFDLKRRDVQSLRITVHPGGAIEVVAPYDAKTEEVCRRVAKRGRLIFKHLSIEKPPPGTTQKEWKTGMSLRYLGRQLRLRVSFGEKESVVLGRNELRLTVSKRGANPTAKVERWLLQQAQQVLQRRFEICLEKVKGFGMSPPRFSLRRMPKRWGSFKADGEILLNPELIRSPSECIDYVIIHELCHCRVKVHSKEFYSFLTRVLPDWKKRKARLERVGAEQGHGSLRITDSGKPPPRFVTLHNI